VGKAEYLQKVGKAKTRPEQGNGLMQFLSKTGGGKPGDGTAAVSGVPSKKKPRDVGTRSFSFKGVGLQSTLTKVCHRVVRRRRGQVKRGRFFSQGEKTDHPGESRACVGGGEGIARGGKTTIGKQTNPGVVTPWGEKMLTAEKGKRTHLKGGRGGAKA